MQVVVFNADAPELFLYAGDANLKWVRVLMFDSAIGLVSLTEEEWEVSGCFDCALGLVALTVMATRSMCGAVLVLVYGQAPNAGLLVPMRSYPEVHIFV